MARHTSLRYFRQKLTIEQKGDNSPVTIADRETETAIKSVILDAFPEHGFYGEESGQVNVEQDWLWVVDPIDGTTSFSTGKPTFGTLISLAYRGKPVIGIIDMPALDDRWIGVSGQPTRFNGEVVNTNQTRTLAESSIFTTTTKMFNADVMQRYQALDRECRFGVFGADCMAYGLLASGFTELVLEGSLKPYDFMALVPVVEGAGGVITDWRGEPVTVNTGQHILAAANVELHRLALAVLTQ